MADHLVFNNGTRNTTTRYFSVQTQVNQLLSLETISSGHGEETVYCFLYHSLSINKKTRTAAAVY
jgi:hypothetical protein